MEAGVYSWTTSRIDELNAQSDSRVSDGEEEEKYITDSKGVGIGVFYDF